jgi:hypothetical protein
LLAPLGSIDPRYRTIDNGGPSNDGIADTPPDDKTHYKGQHQPSKGCQKRKSATVAQTFQCKEDRAEDNQIANADDLLNSAIKSKRHTQQEQEITAAFSIGVGDV